MKIPTSSPWSEPQITGSFAPATTLLETGVDAIWGLCKGPPSWKQYTPTQIAIQLSMIVEITSFAPVVAFRTPAIPAQTAPAAAAATIANAMWSTDGIPTKDEPIQTAMIHPTVYWPWPPMLNMPARNANATARPTRSNDVALSSVCWRLPAAVARSPPLTQGNSQFRPVPLKID